jgi:hypothetical protein
VSPTRTTAILLSTLLLASCGVDDYINENPQKVGAPIFGTAVGVAAGQAIGSSAAELGLGATGAIVGLAAGPYLQKRDLVFFDKAIDQAAVAEPGNPVHWTNPNTGTTGTMVRLKDVPGADFDTCRKLRSDVKAGGNIASEILVVCKPERGAWYIDSSWPVKEKPAG